MRYTQYTHKLSVPIRKELHQFLDGLPHGIKSQIARTFLTKVMRMLDTTTTAHPLVCGTAKSDWKAHLYDLVHGRYTITTETEAICNSKK